MLYIHPKLIEELMGFVAEYASLDTDQRESIRADIKARNRKDKVHILGRMDSQKPNLLTTLFDLLTIENLMMELPIEETIRVTYLRDKGPQVYYWTRAKDGTSGGAE